MGSGSPWGIGQASSLCSLHVPAQVYHYWKEHSPCNNFQRFLSFMEMLIKLRLSRLVTQAQRDHSQALRRRGSRSLSAVSRVPGHQAAHLATPRDCPPLPLGSCLSMSSARTLSVAPLRGLGAAGCPCSPLCPPPSAHSRPSTLRPKARALRGFLSALLLCFRLFFFFFFCHLF